MSLILRVAFRGGDVVIGRSLRESSQTFVLQDAN
jgi:hypothetical protein